MTTDRTEALLRKLRALRAKADDPSITEAEASLYADKVAQLLQQHNLHESSLEQEEPDEIVEERWEGDYLTDDWRRSICNQVAKLYFCSAYSEPTRKPGKAARLHVFVGKAHNIAIARDMSEYLINTTLRLAKDWRKANFATHSEFVNFLRGCGIRISERVYELYKAQREAVPQRATSGNPANLPALYEDESKLIQEFLKSKGLKNMRRGPGASGHGGAAGYAAGGTVSLQTQVGQNSKARLLS